MDKNSPQTNTIKAINKQQTKCNRKTKIAKEQKKGNN